MTTRTEYKDNAELKNVKTYDDDEQDHGDYEDDDTDYM